MPQETARQFDLAQQLQYDLLPREVRDEIARRYAEERAAAAMAPVVEHVHRTLVHEGRGG